MYFSNFNNIKYKLEDGREYYLKDLLTKIKINESVFNRRDVYYPYILEDWERPDTVAADYYGSSKYFWVVLLSNMIIDPYFQWPLDYEEFKSYLRKKYNTSIENLKSTILHYKYTGLSNETPEQVARKSWTIPVETYNLLPPDEKSGWSPVYVYDYEFELNEKRRKIRLLDNYYLPQAVKEFEILTKRG